MFILKLHIVEHTFYVVVKNLTIYIYIYIYIYMYII